MKTIITFLLVFYSISVAQDLQKDFEILAKYSILKYSLEKSFNDFANSTELVSSIQELKNTILNEDYSYEVQKIDSIDSFMIISIIDKTNFHLHGNNISVYAINTADDIYKYSLIDEDNWLEYINTQIYPKISLEDQFDLIRFYNSTISYLNKQNGIQVDFYNSHNKDQFELLNEVYNFSDIVSEALIGKRDYYEHVYFKRKEDISIIEFYQVLYFFECDKLKIEKFLLLKVKA